MESKKIGALCDVIFPKERGNKGRSSHPKVFLEKGVLKICSKFTGENSCPSVISIKLQDTFS